MSARRCSIGLLCLLAASLTACSSTASAPNATTTVTRTVTAGTGKTSTAAASSTTSASGTASPAVLKLGQKFTIPGQGFTAQVIRFDDNAGKSDKSSERYVAVLVKVCSTSKASSVSYAPWSLIGADDGTSATTVTGGGLNEPQYIDGNSLAVGECARGWITFSIAKSQRIAKVKYAPGDDDGNELPGARWVLPR